MRPDNPAYISDRCIASLLFSKFLVKFFLILIFGDVFSNNASPLTSVDSFLFRKTSFEELCWSGRFHLTGLLLFYFVCFFLEEKKWFKRHSCNKFVAALFFFSLCSSIAATNLLHLAFFSFENRGGKKKKRQRHKKENTGGLNPGLS